MWKIKKSYLFAISLMLAIAVYSSVALAKAGNGRPASSTEYRSNVANFVQSLLNVADREQKGIGEQVREVAQQQNESKDRIAEAMDKVEARNGIKTFLIGTDYKNIGQLRREMVKTGSQIDWLKKLLERTTTTSSKAMLQEQIQKLEQEQLKINEFVRTQERKLSLFGWFAKMFAD